MPTALEQTYIKIGRLYVESLSFAERVEEYLEILEFAEFSDIVEFAATTKSGKARKKPTCNPAKSQLCGGSCVALSKQCKKNVPGAEKQAAGFVSDVVQAKKKGGAKAAGAAKQKTSGAAEAGLNLSKTLGKVRAEAEKKVKPVEPAVTPTKTKAEKELIDYRIENSKKQTPTQKRRIEDEGTAQKMLFKHFDKQYDLVAESYGAVADLFTSSRRKAFKNSEDEIDNALEKTLGENKYTSEGGKRKINPAYLKLREDVQREVAFNQQRLERLKEEKKTGENGLMTLPPPSVPKTVEPAITPATSTKAKKTEDVPPKAETPKTDTPATSTVKDTPESIRAHYQRRSDEMGTGLSAEMVISKSKDGKGLKDGTLTYKPDQIINGARKRLPVDFIAGKSDASEEQVNRIAEYLTANGKNIVPVFVRKTGEDKYDVVHNAQILDAARKAKQDFIRVVEVDDVMERQLRAELARNKSAQDMEDDGSPVVARKEKDQSGLSATVREVATFATTERQPTAFVSGKSDADSKQVDDIAAYLKETQANIMPVLVRKTSEDKFEAVYNNQILEGARKAGLDFVQTIQVDKAMERQAMAEMGLSQ